MKKDNDASAELLRKVLQANVQRILENSATTRHPLSQDGEVAADVDAPEDSSKLPRNADGTQAKKVEHDETPDADLLRRKKDSQKLEQRKKLLNRLLVLFAVQMVCMNIVVAFVVFASCMSLGCFREMSDATLSTLAKFMTFYITAVLAELLAAIVYIVHKVFSE